MLQDTTTSRMKPAIALEGISKSFPGVRALSDVSLALYPGSVTALVGENGAGKSTLVKILTGIYQPDAGTIRLGDTETTFPTALAASRAGVTAIYQETVLFDELSVAENIFLGHAPRNRFGLIDWKQLNADAQALLGRAGADFDPTIRLRDLGIAKKHLVAIARALSVDARVVIMDEPTAALSHKEIHELYDLIERLKADGKAVLFISHKFDEIFRIADRYTVFRDGAMIGEGLIADVSQDDLVRMMVGRAVGSVYPKKEVTIGQPVLTVSGYRHPTEFEDINFELRRGEILGFYGLVGAGRSEFMQSLIGITRPSAGAVKLDGEVLVIRSPAEAIRAGIVYVPEERGRQGGDHRHADLPECDAALAFTHLALGLPAACRGIRAGARIHLPPRSAGRRARSGRRHAFRRQPAEGGHRQVARDPAEGHHPRRADQGHRHRLQGRRSCLHERACGARLERHHGVLGNSRDHGDV